MTDTIPLAPISPRGRPNPRGGRRRGGPGSNDSPYPDGSQRGHGFRGGRVERERPHRERRDLSHNSFMPDGQLRIGSAQSPEQTNYGGKKVDHLNAKQISQGQAGEEAIEDQERAVEEGEVCFICASTIEHLSIAPCNHQTCHICALRLRALYKKRDCAYCKVREIALQLPGERLTITD